MINWPVPSYVGETYTSPNGKSWAWNGYGWDTLGSATVEGDLLYIEVQPNPSVIRELPGQSFELIPAPGPGKYLDIAKIICESNAGASPATSAYNYVSADYLFFSHADQNYISSVDYIGSVYIGTGVPGALWRGNVDSFAIVDPYGMNPVANIFKEDHALNVGIDDANVAGNNATVGDHSVTFKIFYRIKDLTI
jgi:hypothetical protein